MSYARAKAPAPYYHIIISLITPYVQHTTDEKEPDLRPFQGEITSAVRRRLLDEQADAIDVAVGARVLPDDFRDLVAEAIIGDPTLSWDAAVADILTADDA